MRLMYQTHPNIVPTVSFKGVTLEGQIEYYQNFLEFLRYKDLQSLWKLHLNVKFTYIQ